MKTDEIRKELFLIKGDRELLKGEDVVEWAAANPASSLYGCFEWDDAKAGHEFRLMQARTLIVSYVRIDSGPSKFVSLTIDRNRPGGGYREIESVMEQPALREALLRDALRELRHFKTKYQQLAEFARLYKEIERLESKYGDREAA